MIQNQQATINKTQNDLDYWTSQKNQLTSQLSEAQNRVNQLTTQVKDLESKQAQLQSSLDSDLAKEQQVESSAKSKEAEANRLQDLIQTRSKEKSAAETTLRKCEADIQKAKNQVDALSYEINLVVVHPYLQWGGLAIFAVAVAALIVTTVGVATLIPSMRAGIGRARRLRRTGPVPEIGTSIATAGAVVEVPVQGAGEAPAEMAGEAPTEVPAKSVPESKVVQTETEAPEIEGPGKRTRPASKRMKRKESTRRKIRIGKKAGGRS
jgi:archaellum component FlaC